MSAPAAPSFAPETSRAQALAQLRRAFLAAGLDEAALDARRLLTATLAIDATALAVRPDEPIGAAASLLTERAARRLAREPVSRILGEREFWGLPFRLAPDTLDPRPDTETLVETALGLLPDVQAPARILDLGTGSGCILVALLHERPRALGVGIDRSLGALRAARHNARRNGVAERALFVAGNWGDALAGRFDLVASNPPYIPSGDVPGLAWEVRHHDPAAALDGGPDGLDAYRAILRQGGSLLAPGGALVLEIGIGQADDVAALAPPSGLRHMRTCADLAGIDRVLVFRPD